MAFEFNIDDRRPKTHKTSDLVKQKLVTAEVLKDWLRSIHEIRFFEQKVYDLLGQNIIKGASHLYAGQEAVAVGAIAAMEKGDVIGSTHRGHGHCGAVGNKYAATEQERQTHWNRMMAELMGKETGYCNGRGGSMHIADVNKCNNLGSTGIVGGNQPPAVGAAFAEKYKGTGKVVLSFFGDGSTNTGTFHESLNMAATWQVPMVAIIENNLYGMSVPFHKGVVEGSVPASNITDIAVRSAAYNMPAMIVDGQDVVEVFMALRDAIKSARQTNTPVMVEAKTYRWYGHSRSDAREYRTKDEEKAWHDRDPITVLSNRLVSEGLATQAELDAIKTTADATIEAATKFAVDSPLPDPKNLTKDVYVVETYSEKVKSHDVELAEKSARATEAYEHALANAPKGMSKKDAAAAAAEMVKREYGMQMMGIGAALCRAQAEEMRRDKKVFIMGEDVGLYGGAYAATKGLLKEFGAERIRDTAISEAAITGAAVGAALRGLRPIAEIMYVDFLTIAMDQLVHNAAYNRYMFGGHAKVPMVLRTEGGVGRCIAAHHSESLEAWLVHVPGLHVVMPSTPYDAIGLLKSAIRSDNPVVFIEHKATYNQMGAVPTEEYVIPIGVADIKKEGKDVTMVSYSRMAMWALESAKKLAAQGVDAEVIDLRSLKPMDIAAVAKSVRKTGKLVTISEGFGHCGIGREIVGALGEYQFEDGTCGFDWLDAKPLNLAAADVPPPMSEPLELASIPNVATITEAVKKMF
jgi:2-oxoisovalerate dehydrogenase E1 component